METKELLAYFLPDGILEYFELKDVKSSNKRLTFILEEKPLPIAEQSEKRLHSKGFYAPVQIQDFPIRKKACYLEVKRRRWINIDTKELYSRDWDLVAKGTRKTSEFALFLKRFIG